MTYQAPTIQRPREIQDSSGRVLGRSDGFRPDPGSGGLGLEIELTQGTAEAIDADLQSVWVPERWVIAVRRDRIVLDRSLEELRRFLPTEAPPEVVDPSANDELAPA